MAKFVYEGEADVVLPTLGLTVSTGDVIEAPDDFAVAGFTASTKKVSKVSDADPAPVEVAPEVAPVTSDATAPAATDTAPAASN